MSDNKPSRDTIGRVMAAQTGDDDQLLARIEGALIRREEGISADLVREAHERFGASEVDVVRLLKQLGMSVPHRLAELLT